MEKVIYQESASHRLIRFFDVTIAGIKELIEWALLLYDLVKHIITVAGPMFRRIMRWQQKPKHINKTATDGVHVGIDGKATVQVTLSKSASLQFSR